MRKVIVECVGGVQIVFGKRESAGGRGSPGVNQCRLNHLIFFGAPPHEGSAVFLFDPHPRLEVDSMAVVGEFIAHDGVRDDGIDLHRGDIAAAAGQRASHVIASSGADHQRFGGGRRI